MYGKTSVSDIPSVLDTYTLFGNTTSIAYKNDGQVHSFVHFSDNLFSQEEIISVLTDLCIQKINSIDINYVCFYSPMFPSREFIELEKRFTNFVYYHQPLIAFGQIPGHVDVDSEPPVHIQTEYTKNYCCLINRNTATRLQLFNFLHEKNILKHGHVSNRNVNRSNSTNLISEPYKNFEDVQYTDDQTDNPRRYVWYYPLLDFLFDFSIETYNEDVPFLTEKSTKAFFWGKIPVSTSCRNLMHYVEQFGFDIFRDVVNYNYDIQRDPYMRMELYLQEVHKLATMNIKDIPNLKSRLDSNQELMCELVRRGQTILANINSNTRYINENKDKFLGCDEN